MKVMVETSARHMHVSEEDLKVLFGANSALTNKKELSQPGQFACEERVEVIGPRGSLKMTILGPTRPETQVEVSMTDARTLGITAPIRESGDLNGSAACTIKGPAGEIKVDKGVIIAKRHIHMMPADAEKAGVEDKQIVSVELNYNGRKTVYGDVVCRVSPSYALAMHVDTDESNAAGGLPVGAEGEIIL